MPGNKCGMEGCSSAQMVAASSALKARMISSACFSSGDTSFWASRRSARSFATSCCRCAACWARSACSCASDMEDKMRED